MMDDYLARLNNADMALWQQVEKSLLLAPYWLDGHYLSAQTALRLGYKQVADAIRDEVTDFLARLPALINLLFNDRTPFVSEQTKQWLASSGSVNQTVPVVQTDEELQAAKACFDENGLKPRCGTWKTCPKVIPATSFTASFSARSYWKRPVWFSLHNSSTGCSSEQDYT